MCFDVPDTLLRHAAALIAIADSYGAFAGCCAPLIGRRTADALSHAAPSGEIPPWLMARTIQCLSRAYVERGIDSYGRVADEFQAILHEGESKC